MELSDKSFQILDALDRHEVNTQRQLAEYSGVSLAQVNYLLQRLLQKGLVKVKNFKKNPDKTRYLYLLTPRGLEAKSQAAGRFFMSKLREYNRIRNRLHRKLSAFENGSPLRVALVGPALLKDFVDSVIHENHLQLALAYQLNHWKDLKKIDPESFDIALISDGNSDVVAEISEQLNVPMTKLAALW